MTYISWYNIEAKYLSKFLKAVYYNYNACMYIYFYMHAVY